MISPQIYVIINPKKYIKENKPMAKKNALLALVDDLPWIVKLILCIPALNIVWAIYRIVKGVTESNIVSLVAGIVWIIGSFSITWILDLVFVAMKKQPLFA